MSSKEELVKLLVAKNIEREAKIREYRELSEKSSKAFDESVKLGMEIEKIVRSLEGKG